MMELTPSVWPRRDWFTPHDPTDVAQPAREATETVRARLEPLRTILEPIAWYETDEGARVQVVGLGVFEAIVLLWDGARVRRWWVGDLLGHARPIAPERAA